jgi:chemotaxis protein CheX
MQLEQRQVHQVVEQVWAAILGWQVDAGNETSVGRTGQVPISGAWEGLVALTCDEELARQAAGAMFDCDPELLTSAEIDDALGELANIVGGNLRPLLPQQNRMGLPRAVDGLTGKVVMQVPFRSFGRPFQITLLDRSA